MKSKAEQATHRIKRLSEVLNSYKFNLYYLKGKDLILSDFLSRIEEVTSEPHEVIPISFSSYSILTKYYYTFSNLPENVQGSD